MNPHIRGKILGRRLTAKPAAPSNIAVGATNANASNTTSCTNTLGSIPAGSYMVLTVASAEDSNDDFTGSMVNSVPGLDWEPIVRCKGLHSANVDIFSAYFAAGGSITTTAKKKNGTGYSTVLYRLDNIDLLRPIGTKIIRPNQALPNNIVGTTRPNSILIMVSADWSATDGTSRVYLDSPTEVEYDPETGIYMAYHYYKITTTVGNYTEGMSAPVGSPNQFGTCIVEFRGKP